MKSQGFDVVTGGAGFIGSHLAETLLAAGRPVRILDNFASGHRRNLSDFASHPALEVVEGDIRDPSAVRAALASNPGATVKQNAAPIAWAVRSRAPTLADFDTPSTPMPK